MSRAIFAQDAAAVHQIDDDLKDLTCPIMFKSSVKCLFSGPLFAGLLGDGLLQDLNPIVFLLQSLLDFDRFFHISGCLNLGQIIFGVYSEVSEI